MSPQDDIAIADTKAALESKVSDGSADADNDFAPPINDAPPPDDVDFAPSADVQEMAPMSDAPPPEIDPGVHVPSPLAAAGRSSRRGRGQGQAAPSAPCDIDAERAILTNGLLQANRFAGVLGDLKADDFFEKRNGVIFDAMRRLAIDNEPIDPISVHSELNRQGTADRSGGLSYLFELQSHAGSGLAIEFYAKRVTQLGHVRRILVELHKAQAQGMQMGLDPDGFIEMVQNTVVSQLEQVTGSGSTVHIDEVVEPVYDKILEMRDDKRSIVGIRSGFRDIDKMLLGFHRTDLMILAARPAMGKTSLALNLAYNVANAGHRVMVFSLEMGKEQLVQRLMSYRAGVNLKKIRTGEIDTNDEVDLRQAAGNLSELNFYIDDTPGLSAVEVRARAKRVQLKEGGMDLIVLDYLQLMRGTGGGKQSREQEVSEISRSLKGLAKELNCTVLALSQLNRAVESRPDKTPRMSDLRESGSIEQDADIICFIYREVVYNENADPNTARLIVSKHRAGEIGKIPLYFDGRFTRFATDDRMNDNYSGNSAN